jgi:hypothetical protein
MPTTESGLNSITWAYSTQYQVINSCSEECFDRGSEIEGCSSGEEGSTSSSCHPSSSVVVRFPPGSRVIVALHDRMEAPGIHGIMEGHLFQSKAPL